MSSDKYAVLKSRFPPEFQVPASFFTGEPGGGGFCIFMISCLGVDRFLHLDKNFEDITGYPNERFIKEGMDFWLTLIRPQDIQSVSAKIIENHKALFSPDYNQNVPPPLTLDYSFKNSKGDWIPIRDTRYLVSFNEQKVIDKVVCRFELLTTAQKEAQGLNDMLQRDKSCTRLLEFAMVNENAKSKHSISDPRSNPEMPVPDFVAVLTKREKEILRLISDGLSTKMIADKCHISVHTVETHRRHLLEKLEVRNSMELIKKASKVYWFN